MSAAVQPPALCPHLQPVLADLLARGARVTFAGQAWTHRCRTWVYLDGSLGLATLRRAHRLDPAVIDHTHIGTHEGSEHGFVCTQCQDAIMGPAPIRTGSDSVQR